MGLISFIVNPSVIGTRSIVTYLVLIAPNIKLPWGRALEWRGTAMRSCICQLDLRAQLVRSQSSLDNDKGCFGLD